MIVALKCQSCKAPISADDKKSNIKCEYCGVVNVVPGREESTATVLPDSNLGHKDEHYIENVSYGGRHSGEPNRKLNMTKKPRLNGCGLAALIVFCWPGAIAYGVWYAVAVYNWNKHN